MDELQNRELLSSKVSALRDQLAAINGGLPVPDYCENHAINIILSFSLERARAEGIQVQADLRIPENIPVDALELSAVLTSAIENAITACRKIPEKSERRLEISCYSTPRFVFEVANTYTGEIPMDENSVPIPPESGPDIGTRSINAFVQKHKALADYDVSGGMFRVRVALLDLED